MNTVKRRLLQGYYYFLGKEYSSKDRVLMHHLVYFLQIKGWTRTEYEFEFASQGVYSKELDDVLNMISDEDVTGYYKCGIEEITMRDWKWLNRLSDLYIRIEYESNDDWIKALSCMHFVKNSVLPDLSFYMVKKWVQKNVSLPDSILQDAWLNI